MTSDNFARRRPAAAPRPLRRHLRWLALSLSVATLLACRVGGSSLDGGPGRAVGPAPSFGLNTLDGQRLVLADLRGQAVVLNFWASWCAPCRGEMPHFERVWQDYRDRGVVVVGAAIEDDLVSARQFAGQLGITYPLGLDEDRSIARSYEIVGLPGTMFIGRDGSLVRRWIGVLSEQQLIDFVEEIAR